MVKSTEDFGVYSKDNFSLASFIYHTKKYLNNELAMPWCRASSVEPTDGIERIVHFTFSDGLLKTIMKQPNEWKKDFTAALKYGYIGYTNGGRNGIVRLRKEDAGMQERVNTYTSKDLSAYNISKENAEGVKIVVHRKNGLRTIGVHDKNTNNILFFDQMLY